MSDTTYTNTNADRDADKTRIREADPEHEPEYVGAHSEPIADQCVHVDGEFIEEIEYCDIEATHTIVMRSPNGELHEVSMCDDHGEPEDARRG